MRRLAFHTRYIWLNKNEETKDSLVALVLDHLPAEHRQADCQMMYMHFLMRNGQLWQIDMVQHCIATLPGAQTCTHLTYHAGSTARAIVQECMDVMLQRDVVY